MANIKVYSRSNVAGDPYLWRPPSNMQKKEVPTAEIGVPSSENTCDGVNDYLTTYVTKRIWVAQTGVWLAPLYVQCFYVQ